jgi:hypothetical protein
MQDYVREVVPLDAAPLSFYSIVGHATLFQQFFK